MRIPSSSMMRCTSMTSAADRTNDSAIMSHPTRSAQRKSSTSFSDRAGTLTATPGRLSPLLLEIVPPSTTRVTTRGPSTAVTSRATLPSSIKMRSPGSQSPGSPANVVEHIVASPSTSSVVMVNVASRSSSTGPPENRPSRILGP